MEKLFCKLIFSFSCLLVAISAQAKSIGNASPEFNPLISDSATYFLLEESNGWQAGEKDIWQKLFIKAVDSRQYTKPATSSAYESAFHYQAREFDSEIANFRLGVAVTAENILNRVKGNIYVPESGSIMIFAIGLFSLIMTRRKLKA